MSADTYPHPYPDPEIAALVERLRNRMAELGQRQDELLPVLQGGTPLAKLHDGAPEDRDALYAVAKMLCDKGAFTMGFRSRCPWWGTHGETIAMPHEGRACTAFTMQRGLSPCMTCT